MTSERLTSTSYRDEPLPDGDWPAQAADSIERVVGAVRSKTTGPALTATRALVYGTFAGIVGVAVAVLFGIAAVRVVNNYLPDSVFGTEHTWAADLIVGLFFVIVGGALWTRRRAVPSE